jgi:hypothetical protein
MASVVEISVPVNINGQVVNVNVKVGEPEGGHHPLHFQNVWLGSEKGGTINPDVMDAIEKLYKIAKRAGVFFPDLVQYAMAMANSPDSTDKNEKFDQLIEEGDEGDDDKKE